ncbi:MAG: hypothetical protein OHK0052_16500 [Anaerolineales bacterium]
MSHKILIDTDIFIDVGREVPQAVTYLQKAEAQTVILVSTITQMELMIGCQNKSELRKVEHFLRRYEIAPTSEEISEIAVTLLYKYRLSHGLLIADAIIAATAINLNAAFASKNQKDYRFIEGLTLLPYA